MFEEINKRFGEVIAVAKEKYEKGILEYGRVYVRSTMQLFIN